MMDRCSKCHQRHDGPCPSVKRIEAALALAEAVETLPDGIENLYPHLAAKRDAYRATAPKPPRTRAEVDAEKGRYLVAALAALNRGDIPWCRQMLQDALALCAEPTADPPPYGSSSDESASSPRVDAAAGATFLQPWECSQHKSSGYGPIGCPLCRAELSGPRPTPATKESSDTAGVEAGVANRITDHDADQREAESCGCEQSDELNDKLQECRRLLRAIHGFGKSITELSREAP